MLDEQEKAELRQAFGPIEYDENGKPSEYFLNYNAEWRRDLRYFDEDLANGQHESDWLDEAKEAMEERASGGFDNWKEQNFEEFWGQKYRGEDQANEIQRDEPVKGKKRSNRGKEKRQDDRAEEKPRDILEGQEMPNLKRLALDRMVDTGDVFRYVRHFGPKNASHILEKDIEV